MSEFREEDLKKVVQLLEHAVNGEVSHRLVNFPEDSVLMPLVNPINDFLDRIECVLRELMAVFDASTNRQFYRKFLSDGLNGTFLQVAESANRSLRQVADLEAAKSELAEAFRLEVGQNSANILEKIQILTEVNAELTANVEEMTTQVERGENRGKETTFRVQSVATAAEELSSSISEISMQTEQTNENANDAIGKLAHALDTVKEIDNSAEDVSGIVSIIEEVARQTNLLALNAAIEAARAGEAGRGFGVVASEVKELANQTRGATRDIIEKIDKMKGATSAGLIAMKGVDESLNSITELFGAISTAIQEQSSVTQEIARNAEEAALSTTGLQDDLSQIARWALMSGESVNVSVGHVEELGKMADQLDKSSQNFVRQILE